MTNAKHYNIGVVMLRFVDVSVVMQSVVMLSVVMLNGMAPSFRP